MKQLLLLSTLLITLVQFSLLQAQHLVKNINSGSADSNPEQFTAIHGRMYFIATQTITGTDYENIYYYTDGAIVSSTKELKYPGSDTDELVRLVSANDKLYFFSLRNDATTLWMADGTSVQEIQNFGNDPGDSYSVFQASNVYQMNNLIFFTMSSTLWVINTTTDTVYALDSSLYVVADSFSGAVVGNTFYFFAYKPGGNGLWSTDGTTATYVSANDAQVGKGHLLGYNSRLYIIDQGTTNSLWVKDGSSAPTMVKDLGTLDPYIEFLAGYNGHVYFTNYNTTETSLQLWQTDGTEANTGLFDPIIAGEEFSSIDDAIVYDGKLFFTAYYWGASPDPTSNVYWTNGTPGTVNAVAINSDLTVGSSPRHLTVLQNKLYLSADDGSSGQELWRINGITPSLVGDINTGSSDSSPQRLTAWNDDLFFSADDGGIGTEPWHLKKGKELPLWHEGILVKFEIPHDPCVLINCGKPQLLDALIIVFNGFDKTLHFPIGPQNYFKGLEKQMMKRHGAVADARTDRKDTEEWGDLGQPEYFEPGYQEFSVQIWHGQTLAWVLTDGEGNTKSFEITAPDYRSEDTRLHLYPVPVQETLSLSIGEEEPQKVIVQILNERGAVVFREKLIVSTRPQTFSRDELGLQKGIYIMKATFANGDIETIRFSVES
ncbi:MAG: T9SS type A sorting domain-containing protein [Bacteroidota bacterium]